MKIYTNDSKWFGKSFQTSSGLIKWDSGGVAEVSEQAAKSLIASWPDKVSDNRESLLKVKTSQLDGKQVTLRDDEIVVSKQEYNNLKLRIAELESMVKQPTPEQIPEPKEVELKSEDTESKLDKEEQEKQLIEEFNRMTVSELQDFCTSLEYKKEEYINLRKKELINYIVDKSRDA